MKPRPFVVSWSVNVEHLDRIFESAVYPAKPNPPRSENRSSQKIPTRAEYFVAFTLNDRQ